MAPKLYLNDDHTLIIMDNRLVTDCSGCFEPVKPGQMRIIYSWQAPSRDLDTCTVFNGGRVGYASGPGNEYLIFDSSDNTQYGPETAWVLLDQAHDDGVWTAETEVKCWAGWYAPAGGSGGCTLRVTYNGDTQFKSVSFVGRQKGSAEGTTLVGTITVNSDGTFTLR
jgi:hypothetical protein